LWVASFSVALSCSAITSEAITAPRPLSACRAIR
jgi:hypothetical protein